MIAPAVPGWIVLLFLALYALIGFAVLALVVRFLLGIVRLVFRDDSASWLETTLLAGIILIAAATYWIATADSRAAENRLDSIVELSVLDHDDFTNRRVDVDRPCGGASARGPGFSGNEEAILEVMTTDADRFETDGWSVKRLVNAPDRRARSYIEFSPWEFTARRDPLLVIVNIENDKYSFRVFDGDCSEPDFVGAPFVDHVERFPDVPNPGVAPEATRITELVGGNGPQYTRPSDLSFPLIHGLGVDLDCFVASGIWDVWTPSERRELISSVAESLERDGWTVQREAQLAISVQPDVRFVARRGDEVIDGSTDRDGIMLTEFPTGCATIGPHPRPLLHFEPVERFSTLSD